jgi:hypothetical protein
VLGKLDHYNGEVVSLELTPGSHAQLETLIAEREGMDAVQRFLDMGNDGE